MNKNEQKSRTVSEESSRVGGVQITTVVESSVVGDSLELRTSEIIGGCKTSLAIHRLNTQEEAIKNGLIEMGWTPPADPKALVVREMSPYPLDFEGEEDSLDKLMRVMVETTGCIFSLSWNWNEMTRSPEGPTYYKWTAQLTPVRQTVEVIDG